MNDALTRARALAALGCSVIPIPPGTKRPNIRWATYQTTRPTDADLLAWFGPGRTEAMAVVTGAISGVVVVDTDSAEAEEWARTHLPATRAMVRTRKGWHRYYRAPGCPVRNSARIRTGQGQVALDVRGDGGYVLAPGSPHPDGGLYEPTEPWTPELLAGIPAFDPGWLAAPPAPPASSSCHTDTAPGRPSAYDRARAWLERRDPAVEGSGGDQWTYVTACNLVVDFGLTDQEALDLLRPWNQTCRPPWPEADLLAKIASARKSGNGVTGSKLDTPLARSGPDHFAAQARARREHEPEDSPENEKETQAEAMLRLFREAEGTLWHDSLQIAYCRFRTGEHQEVHPVQGPALKRALTHWFYRERHGPPAAENLNAVVGVLEARAQFDGGEQEVALRVTEHGGALYVDLGDPEWQVARITAAGWEVLTESPVPFRRARVTMALPTPEHAPGELDRLRDLLGLAGPNGEEHFRLLILWLLGCYHPTGPYPVLVLMGENGSYKSTTARMILQMVDPSRVNLRQPPKDIETVMIAANNTRVLAYDNLSSIPPWLSDTLCCVSTGGGATVRELYTNAGEAVFDVARPVLLTGIALHLRPDLLDRAIVMDLDPAQGRRTEAELWAEFDRWHPRLLGALFTVLAGTWARLEHTSLPDPPRMADFARWIQAAEPSLGWEPGTALQTYRANRRDGLVAALDADRIFRATSSLMNEYRTVPWEGSSSDLKAALEAEVPRDKTGRLPDDWPRTIQSFGERFARICPSLRACGIDVARTKGAKGLRTIILRRREVQG